MLSSLCFLDEYDCVEVRSILKWLFIFLILPLLVANGGLQFISAPNENQTIFANCQFNHNYVNSQANISVFYPNQTNFINNVAMNSYSTGKFSYEIITPTTLGIYEIEVFCDDIQNNKTGYATGVFQIKDIEEEVFGMLAIIFAVVAVMGVLFYVSSSIGSKEHRYPDGASSWILKVTNPQLVSVALHMMAMWCIPILFWLLQSTNQQIFFQMLFWVSLVAITAYSLTYLALYILFKIYVVMWEKRNDWLRFK